MTFGVCRTQRAGTVAVSHCERVAAGLQFERDLPVAVNSVSVGAHVRADCVNQSGWSGLHSLQNCNIIVCHRCKIP